mmetsp:Transcript_124965/g.364993  ORF Transcript_124965/g.364993 Transcript_124965/m.364993 type:complete len:204 (+) Transcript_124965:5894-6505(+)
MRWSNWFRTLSGWKSKRSWRAPKRLAVERASLSAPGSTRKHEPWSHRLSSSGPRAAGTILCTVDTGREGSVSSSGPCGGACGSLRVLRRKQDAMIAPVNMTKSIPKRLSIATEDCEDVMSKQNGGLRSTQHWKPFIISVPHALIAVCAASEVRFWAAYVRASWHCSFACLALVAQELTLMNSLPAISTFVQLRLSNSASCASV